MNIARVLMVLLLIHASGFVVTAAERPNIVVFLVDDMGVMDTSVPFMLGADGKPEVHPNNRLFRTPNMERLAKQGVRLTQFYANSVCSPSRVSLLTGQTSARHRTTQYIKPESNNAGSLGPRDWQWKGITERHVTLPALLRQAGYRTIHAGKAHFGPNNSFGELPQNFGFDVNIAGCAYGQPGSYYGTDHFGHNKPGRQKRAVPGLEKYHGQDIYLTEALTLEINASIKQAVADKKPFFAYMSHYAVHAPFQGDKRFAGNYAGKQLKKPVEAFATMIEGMDKSLGDILDQLETLGVADNTIVYFVGDNGTDAPLGPTHQIACAAPLRGKKGTHYEGGMRVPFIASWAAVNSNRESQQRLAMQPGAVVDQVGTIYDLFPTILACAGIDYSGVVDGRNLATILSGKKTDEDATFLMHFPHGHRSSYFTVYREGDWKLVYHYHRKGEQRFELFNLKSDRSESNNLAAANPKQRTHMLTQMKARLQAVDAQYPRDKASPEKQLVPMP